MVEALSQVEQVCLVVRDDWHAEAVGRMLESFRVKENSIKYFSIKTDDSWVRDTGPVFVQEPSGSAVPIIFKFDSWGGKYPPWDLDDALGKELSLGINRLPREADFVLEGGSIDGDGQGTVLTTESCLLRNRKEKGRNRTLMERRLFEWLGARKVIWLDGELAGDDTGGHVDDLARFVAPCKVVVPTELDATDLNYPVLKQNRERLFRARDANENRL